MTLHYFYSLLEFLPLFSIDKVEKKIELSYCLYNHIYNVVLEVEGDGVIALLSQ